MPAATAPREEELQPTITELTLATPRHGAGMPSIDAGGGRCCGCSVFQCVATANPTRPLVSAQADAGAMVHLVGLLAPGTVAAVDVQPPEPCSIVCGASSCCLQAAQRVSAPSLVAITAADTYMGPCPGPSLGPHLEEGMLALEIDAEYLRQSARLPASRAYLAASPANIGPDRAVCFLRGNRQMCIEHAVYIQYILAACSTP